MTREAQAEEGTGRTETREPNLGPDGPRPGAYSLPGTADVEEEAPGWVDFR